MYLASLSVPHGINRLKHIQHISNPARPFVRLSIRPNVHFCFANDAQTHSHTCLFIARVCKRKSECVSARARAFQHISVCLCMFWIMDTIKIFHRITQLFSWSVWSVLFSLPLIHTQTYTNFRLPCKKIPIHTRSSRFNSESIRTLNFQKWKIISFFFSLSLSHSNSIDGIIKIFFHNLKYEKCHARKHAQAHII